MNKKLSIAVSALALMALPAMAMAINTIGELIDRVTALIGVIFFGAAVIYFLVYGIMFLMARGDSTKAGEARMGVMWGVVGIVVGVLAFTIVLIVRNTFGI